MIFIWAGRGGWILGSLLISVLAMLAMDQWIFPPDAGPLPLAAAFGIAGVFCLGLGIHARLQSPQRTLERHTGRERVLPVVHSMYWIRAEYWGLLYLGMAIWLGTFHQDG